MVEDAEDGPIGLWKEGQIGGPGEVSWALSSDPIFELLSETEDGQGASFEDPGHVGLSYGLALVSVTSVECDGDVPATAVGHKSLQPDHGVGNPFRFLTIEPVVLGWQREWPSFEVLPWLELQPDGQEAEKHGDCDEHKHLTSLSLGPSVNAGKPRP